MLRIFRSSIIQFFKSRHGTGFEACRGVGLEIIRLDGFVECLIETWDELGGSSLILGRDGLAEVLEPGVSGVLAADIENALSLAGAQSFVG